MTSVDIDKAMKRIDAFAEVSAQELSVVPTRVPKPNSITKRSAYMREYRKTHPPGEEMSDA